MTQILACRVCGADVPPVKNWTRLSLWRRAKGRRCRTCAGKTHGMSRTRLYREWGSMRVRCGIIKCSNPDAIKYYIERGISVCEEWSEFTVFAQWAVANGYRDDLTLDRIDNNAGYSPSNCRWISMTEQLRNRSDRKLTMAKAEAIRSALSNGESSKALAERYGVGVLHVQRIGRDERWAV